LRRLGRSISDVLMQHLNHAVFFFFLAVFPDDLKQHAQPRQHLFFLSYCVLDDLFQFGADLP